MKIGGNLVDDLRAPSLGFLFDQNFISDLPIETDQLGVDTERRALTCHLNSFLQV